MKSNPTAPSSPTAAGLLDARPPEEVFRSHLELRRSLSVALLGLFAVVLLIVSFAPFGLWPVAYVALVPWVLAMGGGAKGGQTLLFGWLSGVAFWAASLYWLTLPTLVGYFAAVGILSLYWFVACVLVRASMRRGWPMWFVLPVVWVAVEFVRSRVGPLSFSWFCLAQTQYTQLQLLQICDVTGQFGLSFFVAMVNGTIVDILAGPLFRRRRAAAPAMTRQFALGLLATLASLGGLLYYGHNRLLDRTLLSRNPDGPAIGIVQEAIPVALGMSAEESTSQREYLEYHLAGTLSLLGQDLDLVVWPETMLPVGLNAELLNARALATDPSVAGYLDEKEVWSIGWHMLKVRQGGDVSESTLRAAIAEKIGVDGEQDYLAAAARLMLRDLLTDAHIDALDESAARRLAELTLPHAPPDADLDTLRLVLKLSGSGAASEMRTSQVRLAKDWILGADRPIADGPNEQTIRTLRSVLNARARRAEAVTGGPMKISRRDTLRLRAAMVQLMSDLLGCPILAGGSTLRPNPAPIGKLDIWMQENSALWFDPTGPSDRVYSKMHLVPFSEAVPFKYSWPWFHKLLRRTVPEEMQQLNPGREVVRFDLSTEQGDFTLATPVCYEGTVGPLVRRMVAAGPKDRLILLNLSNDGWFVHRRSPDRPYEGTTEHMQHLVHSVFRAVENRVPVVRAVNTGISGWIDSDGRICELVEMQVEDYRVRSAIAGTLVVRPLVDNRTSFYSRYGDWFGLGVCLVAASLLPILWLRRRSRSTSTSE